MSLENDYKQALEEIANDVGSNAKQLRGKAKAALNPVIEYEEVDVYTWTVVDDDGNVLGVYSKKKDANAFATAIVGSEVLRSQTTKIRPKKKQ